MSNHAYRINKIEHEDDPTFNLFHDEAIIDWLLANTSFADWLTPESEGVAFIRCEDIRRMLKELTDMDEDAVDVFKRDLDWAEEKDEQTIAYFCF